MKIILGDNQFFGVNHFDLNKGKETKLKFETNLKVECFIKDSLKIGIDGFMINSNQTGYDIINNTNFDLSKEIHYSIPYPHKYANMVNEKGMMSLMLYLIKNTSILKNITGGFKLLFSQNLKSLVPLALNLEIPNNLRKGSYIFLQNIITDMMIGLGRFDIILEFIDSVNKLGYKPGIITLNPIILNDLLKSNKDSKLLTELIVCFNINKEGFNVFPSKESVEDFIKSQPKYKLMAMSIFASGAANIPQSIDYIKTLKLDYVVFGTSNLSNVKSNLDLLKNNSI